MSVANAEFYRHLGLDPDQITDAPFTVTVASKDKVLLHYQCFLLLPADKLAEAFAYIADPPPPDLEP